MAGAITFDFGSVGDRLPTLRKHELSAYEEIKINFSPTLPLKLSPSKSELFVMNTTLADAAQDNLKSIILTNRGERVMEPDFGANLKAILTEFGTAGFENEVMTRIKTATSKYLPYISLQQMKLNKLDSPPASGLVVVTLEIEYSIPLVNLQNQQITVTLNTIA